MRDVFLLEAVRTPIGRGKPDGALHGIHPVHLLALTLEALVERAGVDKAQVEDVIAGCVSPVGEQGLNVARLAALQAGFPVSVPGVQLNRFCGSGQQAVHFAAQAIGAGDMDLAIACGVESMSRVAMGSDGNITAEFREAFPFEMVHQGQSAEMLVEKWGLSRRELDEYAASSHCRAAAAAREGWTARELVAVKGRTADEGVRANPNVEKMGQLAAAFRAGGAVTAGNSSQISDGAAALLLGSAEKAKELGLRKRARVVTRVVVGTDPVLMLTGPIDATQRALKKAGLDVSEIDVFEINEAFASVVLAWARELRPDMARVNMQGGAIAHGHPLGATGAVLMTKLLHILERTGGRFGLQSMCIGFGMGTATIVERLE
ncbi:MAG: thiolase family protein [Bryobacteraceae bacterium]